MQLQHRHRTEPIPRKTEAGADIQRLCRFYQAFSSMGIVASCPRVLAAEAVVCLDGVC